MTVGTLSIVPPATGYNPFSVTLMEGHVYAVQAREGQEGHHILLRVTKIEGDRVSYDWVYK